MHIYVVSRLHSTQPGRWTQTLARLEEAKRFMVAQYAPLRTAILAETAARGEGDGPLHRGLAMMGDSPTQISVKANSIEAFSTFKSIIQPKIDSLEDNFLEQRGSDPVDFAGTQLSGKCHMAVRDITGRTRYVYVHASQWTPEEREAYLELLTLVTQERYGCDRDDIWFVDLREGRVINPPKAFKRRRKQLAGTVQLLDRFNRVMAYEGYDA